MSATWYIYAGSPQGPYSPKDLKQFVGQGTVTPATLVSNRAEGPWVAASAVKGLFEPPAPPATNTPIASANKAPVAPPPASPPPVPTLVPPAPTTANTTEVKPVTADPHKQMLVWLVGGGVALVSLMFLTLILVIAWFGASFLRKVDDEALQAEKKRLQDISTTQEKQATEEKAKQDREKWLQAGFDSQVAKKIRENLPPSDTPLLSKLRSFRIEGVPLDWTKESPVIRSASYNGKLTHGSPFLIDDYTLAMITDLGGFNFQLWHLNLKNGEVRLVKEVNDQNRNARYDSAECHRINGQLQMQFVTTSAGQFKGVPKFRGTTVYGDLNLANGHIKGHRVDATSDNSLDVLRGKLLRDKYPESTRVSLTSGNSAVNTAQSRLANLGMTVNVQNGTVSLIPAKSSNWETSVRSITLSNSAAPGKLVELERNVESAPPCPLTKEFKTTLQFAKAVSREDLGSVRSFMSSHESHKLYFPAAMTQVHLIAKESDKIQDYMKFQQDDDVGTAARDFAILRIHELAYLHMCKQATVEGFDDFMEMFPGASQFKQAFQNAYDLELELARFEIEHASEPEKRREEVATRFYVKWRDALRGNKMAESERMWKILKEEDDFNRTKASADAQNAKDLDDYRKKMLAIQEKRNRILNRIAQIQEQQLQVLGQQLDVARQQAASLEQIAYNTTPRSTTW